MDSLYIAWRYIIYNKVKTITLVTCITLFAVLPLSLQLLLEESEQQLLSRATSTPLVVGAKGSALDLVMNSLYFGNEIPELITMEATTEIEQQGLAFPIPVYVRFKARGFPIVGTTIDYFDFRGLNISQGRLPGILGECVLGASVAERLGLGVGDSVISSPENLFDLAGIYPLKMKVAGVLQRSHSPDDLAVFVDLKTTWIIEGLGHGHMDVTRTTDSSVILERDDKTVRANAKLEHFTEITTDNLDSFHFHGDDFAYPLTAVLVDPNDAKSSAILQGRFLSKEKNIQIVTPGKIIAGLLENIFRIKNVLDAIIIMVGIATLLAIILVFALSLRLRQREISTVFKLGGSRSTIVRLVSAEILIILLISLLVCTAVMLLVQANSTDLVRTLFIR